MEALIERREAYSFSPGPSMLPLSVLNKSYEEILDWNNVGLGVMEISHRSKEFLQIINQAEISARQFLNIPDNYKVLFMQGGATLQNSAVPMNLLAGQETANYLVTGFWGNIGYEESKKYCKTNLVSPIPTKFDFIPERSTWKVDPNGAYFLYTDCETVDGLEFLQKPEVPDQILVSDMTSNLGAQSINVKDYGCVFASCQQNLGIAGDTMVIVRDDLIGKQHKLTPSMANYQLFFETQSIFNTAPVYPIYMTGLVLEYLKSAPGGLDFWDGLTALKSQQIYDVINNSKGFYRARVSNPEHRSRTNIVWYIKDGDEGLQNKFLEEAAQNGLVELQGHFSTGGIRANIYNGMPLEGVKKLRDFMLEFAEKNNK